MRVHLIHSLTFLILKFYKNTICTDKKTISNTYSLNDQFELKISSKFAQQNDDIINYIYIIDQSCEQLIVKPMSLLIKADLLINIE